VLLQDSLLDGGAVSHFTIEEGQSHHYFSPSSHATGFRF